MMSAKILVTGSRGFVGQHVIQHLVAQGQEVIGLTRQGDSVVGSGHPSVTYLQTDWSPSSLQSVLHTVQPEYVMHLAGNTDVGSSWQHPLDVVEVNALLSLRLLEAVRSTCLHKMPKVLLVGTMHEYDLQKGSGAFTESSPIGPSSPYGWSKWFQSLTASMYWELYAVPVTVARVFNVLGPRASKGICAQLVERAVRIARRECPPFFVIGSPNVARDFLDVRDVASAFWRLLQSESETSGQVYNICSGKSTRLFEVIFILAGLTGERCSMHIDDALARPGEPLRAFGSHAKLSRATGWTPEISLETSLRDSFAIAIQTHQKGESNG